MKRVLEQIREIMKTAFINRGFDEKYAMVGISNRPDLCQYQCNGAMAASKEYKKAPLVIAEEVVKELEVVGGTYFAKVEAVKPGFINLSLSDEVLSQFVEQMTREEKFGYEVEGEPKKIIIDYGGPNVAKPLHVGHLRSAVIGESLKRIERFVGHEVIGDIHLGDWGLQMGLIIREMKERQPSLVYFADDYKGDYPIEAPFTISELEEIYPTASEKAKVDETYKKEALQATALLQAGNRGYRALWKHILSVSKKDLKKNYENLNVSFEEWKGESDAQSYIPPMVERLKAEGFAKMSEGALIVDVSKPEDKKEIPPCIILKSDGASLYSTTDLATMVERMENTKPTDIIYVVDKRQEMHFEQVFRTARKTGIIPDGVNLSFLGFGTMNGKDGKPFKTREGGVMRLERLIGEVADEVYGKMADRDMAEEDKRRVSKQVGLAALKYGDLSNQASKDYVFDLDRFASFEGNTGPYIQYTVVRIKSILDKYLAEQDLTKEAFVQKMSEVSIKPAKTESERTLMLSLARFSDTMKVIAGEMAPHKLCSYVYELSNHFSAFYHDNHIMNEEDEERKNSLLKLSFITENILVKCLDLLGIDAPERM